jgi:hypothetical protein
LNKWSILVSFLMLGDMVSFFSPLSKMLAIGLSYISYKILRFIYS